MDLNHKLKLEHLLELKDGWYDEGSKAIAPDIAKTVQDLFNSIEFPDSTFIAPLQSGGLQIENIELKNGADIVIDVEPSGEYIGITFVNREEFKKVLFALFTMEGEK